MHKIFILLRSLVFRAVEPLPTLLPTFPCCGLLKVLKSKMLPHLSRSDPLPRSVLHFVVAEVFILLHLCRSDPLSPLRSPVVAHTIHACQRNALLTQRCVTLRKHRDTNI